MSSKNKSQDDNPTTVDHGTTTPGYVTFANSCGIGGAMLAGMLAFYYGLVATAYLPPPIVGVVPMWTMAIIMLGGTKVAVWASDHSANRVLNIMEKRFAAVLKPVERVSEVALQQAHESGQWKGIATTYRQEHPDSPTSVLPFRRGGNNAN